MKILILTKEQNNYSDYGSYSTESKSKAGLFNSAMLLSKALNTIKGIRSEIASCIDGNDIDNKIHKEKPNLCIIEAIWVTPEKIIELKRLYPKVKIICRIHSKIPFLAMEGIALEWIKEYIKANITVAFNNEETSDDLNLIGIKNSYLPNIYSLLNYYPKVLFFDKLINKFFPHKHKHHYKIGCFGAIRPFKNHLNQAIAAIEFANQKKADLQFFINASRLEQAGENVLKNLRALFKDTPHKLVELGWHNRREFLDIIKAMDICMQVSYTESFNIVAADVVSQIVPIVISPEISWLEEGICNPNSVYSMVKALNYVWKNQRITTLNNINSLREFNYKALHTWKKYLRTI